MNQSKQLRQKNVKMELEIGSIYRIDGKIYQAIEKIRNTIQVIRLNEDYEPQGRAVILGNLTRKDVEKLG